MTFKDKTWLYYLKITLIPMVGAVAIGLLVWQFNMKRIHSKQEKDVSDIVRNVINNQASKNLLLPKIVLINVDSVQQVSFKEKFAEAVVDIITKKILLSQDTEVKSFDLQPLIHLDEKIGETGSYSITPEQFENIKAHIAFLTHQVETASGEVKEEVGRDIDRLNLWVTIWIGVIGFLGIFIPILINIDTSKNAERALKKSGIAFRKAVDAVRTLNKAQSDIDKIPTIESKISDAESRLVEITTKSESIGDKVEQIDLKASSAKKKAEALHLVHEISRLANLEPENLQYVNPEDRISFFKSIIHTIKNALEECREQHDIEIVKDCLISLVKRLTRISFQKFVGAENTARIAAFLNILSNKASSNYTLADYEEIIGGMTSLENELQEAA